MTKEIFKKNIVQPHAKSPQQNNRALSLNYAEYICLILNKHYYTNCFNRTCSDASTLRCWIFWCSLPIAIISRKRVISGMVVGLSFEFHFMMRKIFWFYCILKPLKIGGDLDKLTFLWVRLLAPLFFVALKHTCSSLKCFFYRTVVAYISLNQILMHSEPWKHIWDLSKM